MGRRRKTKDAVSASALSQMGVCERLVVFEHCEGKRPTPAQRVALHRGLRAHQRFASDGLADQSRSGRCFIATHVYGDGPETQVLRRFRDRVLRPSPAGRQLILASYRLAPTVCRAMERWSTLRLAARAATGPAVWLAKRLLAKRETSHDA